MTYELDSSSYSCDDAVGNQGEWEYPYTTTGTHTETVETDVANAKVCWRSGAADPTNWAANWCYYGGSGYVCDPVSPN